MVQRLMLNVTLFFVAGCFLGELRSFADDSRDFDNGDQVYEKTDDGEAVDAISEDPEDFKNLASLQSSQWRCIYHGISSSKRSCFFFYHDNRYTWSEAKTKCRVHGGKLATLNDAVEDAFVRDVVAEAKSLPWIGLNDKGREGIYRWDSGEKVEYYKWAPGEPNNNFGNQDCVCLWGTGNYRGRWSDRKCRLKYGYVCEK
ncbi:C-type lectin lectoxin-Lio2-like [Ptychodera flava]|uniref:C-type lectin lectoxin-Lio2-like n=1 Tax=Ptychodera flava TaxID=63121 RepID=UPI00396A8BB3